MKKSTIAFIAVLSLVFASCDDDWTEALPQVNPQEQAFAVDDITLKSIVPEAVNLQEAYMKDNKVKLFTESVNNLPAGSKIRYELQQDRRLRQVRHPGMRNGFRHSCRESF